MIFTETKLQRAFVVEIQKLEDERGFFARSWCRREFEAHGLNPNLVQCNISYNRKKGTLRGMHYQAPPFEEAKLVRCSRGSIYDVILDLRQGSGTFLQWISIVLASDSYKMLYIPEGIAHGFQTLEDNSEVVYQMSEFYAPEYSRGVRWNDPMFNIAWPDDVRTISSKDQAYENYQFSNQQEIR